jgi:hypothetical protein
MVKSRLAEYEPVLYFGSSERVKFKITVLGSAVEQGAPPPVHAAAGIAVTTFFAVVVLMVWVPAQLVPSVAPVQV